MCFDILENEEIVTYREKDRDILMSIRNGKYLNENRQPIPEFYELVDKLQKRLDYDKENTSLPRDVDIEKIKDLVMEINEQVIKQ